METGIFTQSAVEDTKIDLSQGNADFLSAELKAMLSEYLSGCINVYDEIELKGKLIDYIRKM